MKAKRITIVFVSVLLLLSVTGFLAAAGQSETGSGEKAAAETYQLTFSTGSMGGGFYAIGGGIAEYVSKHVDGVITTAVTSGGVNENINRLDSGQADIGLVSNADSRAAFLGEEPYKKKYTKMRGMGILYMNYGQVFTLEKTGIVTFRDLAGRSVCVGSPGGSMHNHFYDWLGVHDLGEKDLKQASFLPMREAVEALKTGQLDAVMEISLVPSPAITELSLTHKIHLLEFEPGAMDRLIREKPKFLPGLIPAGTYKGVDKDVQSAGLAAMLACREDLPEQLVYDLVKTIFSDESLAYLRNVHAAANGITLEGAALFAPIPLHPGAEKFFKEAGLIE